MSVYNSAKVELPCSKCGVTITRSKEYMSLAKRTLRRQFYCVKCGRDNRLHIRRHGWFFNPLLSPIEE